MRYVDTTGAFSMTDQCWFLLFPANCNRPAPSPQHYAWPTHSTADAKSSTGQAQWQQHCTQCATKHSVLPNAFCPFMTGFTRTTFSHIYSTHGFPTHNTEHQIPIPLSLSFIGHYAVFSWFFLFSPADETPINKKGWTGLKD